MTERERSPLADLKGEIASLGADAKEMAALRLELARLEVRTAAAQAKRLAIGLAVAAVMLLGALPILAVAAAEQLDGRLGIATAGWLAIFGLVLLIGGAACGYRAWRCFRRGFAGIEQTLEELREDAVWLKQWLEK